jgi:nucleoside-diphosphate-sugar epimerase
VDERESSFTNRIHADDLAQACVAAADRAPDNRIYNISDGHPTTMTDYMLQIADLLGLEAPPIISLNEAQAVLSPALLSFLNESKRLDNRRMLKELGIRLRYPTLRQGLPACLPEEV